MCVEGADKKPCGINAFDGSAQKDFGLQFDVSETSISRVKKHFRFDADGTVRFDADEANERRLGLLEFDRAPLQKQELSSKLPLSNEPSAKLYRGARGGAVELLQKHLITCGYLTEEHQQTGVGIFGKYTESALRQFQTDNRLSPSGVYDFATQQAVKELTDGVHRGMRGNTVHGLQHRLVELGLMTDKEVKTGAGIFGPKTEAALKKFQSARGLKADGVLNLATYRMLKKASDARTERADKAGNSSTTQGGNKPIADAALRLIDRKGVVSGRKLCSRFARFAVGAAYKQDPYGGKFGGYFGKTANISAKNFENSPYKVSLKPGEKPQVGDLLFKYDNQSGHVGIYIGDNKVAENSTSRYTRHTDGYKGIRDLDKFGKIDVVVRLPLAKG